MLFEKVTKEHIIQGIKDFEEKGIPNGFGHSSTYDFVYKGKAYPPKSIMAYANFHAEGRTIEPYFKGGLGTDCFKAFERNGFEIKEKLNMIEVVQNFLEQAKTSNLKTKHYLKSYKGLKLKVSFGAGNAARIPWIALLKEPNKVQGGIYPVFLYYKEVEKLVLAYGLSETTESENNWGLEGLESIEEWYLKNFKKKPERYGQSKIKSVYDISNINYEDVQKNLSQIINHYKALKFNTLKEPDIQYDTSISSHFTWVKTYKEIVNFIKDKKEDQIGLIKHLKDAGCDLFNDQDPKGNTVALEVIDPFTFFCYLNKYFKQRLGILQKLAENLNFTIPVDDFGLPSTNPQKVWVFPYKYLRKNNEIDRLWSFFESVLNDNITEEQFQDVLQIRGVANTKLTEILFYTNPVKYFPINGPTKPYLENVFNINPKFKTFKEYKNILNELQSKTSKAFYELSHEAWYWNNNISKETTFFEIRNKFDKAIFDNYVKQLRYIIERLNINENDERVVFSIKDNRLNFIIGQRYAFNLYLNGSKGNYGVISTEKLKDNSEPFKGKDREALYTYFKDFNPDEKEWNSIFQAMLLEFERTTKSGFNKHNNTDFQNYIFDMNEGNGNKKFIDPVNQILYGPPGTGKTYFLKEHLFNLYTSKQTSITKEQHFETVVSSCSWWQVIAIALLELEKGKVSDIFEHYWVKKKASLSNSKTIRPTLWGQLQSHTIETCKFVNVSSRQQPLIFNKTQDSYWEILEDEVKDLAPELYDLKNSVENYNPDPDNIINHYDFVTFHQSFAYEDFIEGIKPVMPENEEETTDLGYAIEDGVFKKLCIRAKNDPVNRYAIFIDEINRGNVSAIFGELITLIEIDKRKGTKNELSIKLPYSKKEFSVPSNLDIYGTMNTADRSVEALDTALRRRFEFKEMMPDYSVIENEEVNGVQLSEVLKTINERIELLIDRDHTIGHSYFFNVNSPQELANAFNNKIVPLLQEYFYGDYGKIGLVLGKGFVEKQKNDKIKFADFYYENANDFINPSDVLKKVESDTIIEAVLTLLGNKETE